MYDVVIIGAGPAGLSAAVYAARYKMNVTVIGRNVGGYTNDAHLVENWLGEQSIEGQKLGKKFAEHVESLGVKVLPADVNAIEKTVNGFKILTDKQEEFETKRIIFATGTERNKLGIKGEKEFYGKGVSYCATCDGFFFRNKTVAVIGGGDAAATAALFLADLADKVYLVHRRDELRAAPSWQDRVRKNPKIELKLSANCMEIKGDNVVTGLTLDNGEDLDVQGVFIEIGATPAGVILKSLGIKIDEEGYVVVDEKQETNVEGIYAAGDITTGSSKLKQMIVAASEGAIATHNAYLAQKAEK